MHLEKYTDPKSPNRWIIGKWMHLCDQQAGQEMECFQSPRALLHVPLSNITSSKSSEGLSILNFL